eukprot:57797_1
MSALVPQSSATFIGHLSFIVTLSAAVTFDVISMGDYAFFFVIYLAAYLIFSCIFLNFIDTSEPEISFNDTTKMQTQESQTQESQTRESQNTIIENYNMEIKEEEKDEKLEEEEEYNEYITHNEKKESEPICNNKNIIYSYPKPTQFQIDTMKQILSENNGDFFHSEEYLDLIPSNKEWINRTLNINTNATRKNHEIILNNFIIPDQPYKNEIEAAFEKFNEWRQWKNGIEWEEKLVKEDMTIYTHSVENEAIDIIKGEGSIIPYSTPIVLGVLLNIYHRKQWDENLNTLIKFKQLSSFSSLVYILVNTPTFFIANRDFVAIVFCYPFEDGSVIMGTKSISHNEYPETNNIVRGTINADFWHITPDFENNINHTKITMYSHISLGGSFPNWLINKASIDIPSAILKIRKYMKSVHDELYKKGSLHIPPFPCLKLLNIDIKWLGPQNNDNNDNDNNDDEKEIKIEMEIKKK